MVWRVFTASWVFDISSTLHWKQIWLNIRATFGANFLIVDGSNLSNLFPPLFKYATHGNVLIVKGGAHKLQPEYLSKFDSFDHNSAYVSNFIISIDCLRSHKYYHARHILQISISWLSFFIIVLELSHITLFCHWTHLHCLFVNSTSCKTNFNRVAVII